MAKPTPTKLLLDGRYALVRQAESKKAILVKLRERGKLTGIVQNNQALSAPQALDLQIDDIVTLFLTRTPQFGTAYGVKVEPLLRSERLSKWGLIHYFRDLTNSEHLMLVEAYARAYRLLVRKYNLQQLLLPITIEVRQNSGNISGSWSVAKGDTTGTMRLFPKSFIELKCNGIVQLIVHELGHPLWSNYLPDRIKAKWVRMYHSSLELLEFSLEDVAALRRDFITSGDLPSVYRKALTEENQPLFDACLAWIGSNHYLIGPFLDLLVADGEDLKQFWPRTKLHLAELQDLVSEYAKKNPCEMWCEALSLFATKQPLPSKVRDLVVRSLKSIKTSSEEE